MDKIIRKIILIVFIVFLPISAQSSFTPGLIRCASGVDIRIKIIEIGDWDLNTTAAKSVAHGLDHTKIRPGMSAVIRHDTGAPIYEIIAHDGAASSANIDSIDATNINLIRANGGHFDNAGFDSTSYNRGWILIFYQL